MKILFEAQIVLRTSHVDRILIVVGAIPFIKHKVIIKLIQ